MFFKLFTDELRKKRNQLAFVLVVKNPSFVYSKLALLVEKGYKVESTIDKAVKKIKNTHIKEKYKIQ